MKLTLMNDKNYLSRNESELGDEIIEKDDGYYIRDIKQPNHIETFIRCGIQVLRIAKSNTIKAHTYLYGQTGPLQESEQRPSNNPPLELILRME